MRLEAQLAKGIAALGVILPEGSVIRLLQYLDLVDKWGKVYNLTAIREPEAMLSRHLLDSLAVLPYIAGTRIADVGSGAGLPGIPLALARPDWHVILIESNQKKAIFLRQACIELDLKNVEIIAERVENFGPKEKFDTVISRAFSSLAVYVKLVEHLCKEANKEGMIVAMKGAKFEEEAAQIPEQFIIDKVLPVMVPGLNAKRYLVLIKQK